VLPGLQAGGTAPRSGQVLLHLASPGRWSAVAYVDELTARSLTVGQAAQVGLDARPLHRQSAHVLSVAPQPTSLVTEPMLVQAHGGMIDAREAPGGWVPAHSLYRVTLSLDEPLPLEPRSWRGHLRVSTAPESWVARLWRRANEAWWREAGF